MCVVQGNLDNAYTTASFQREKEVDEFVWVRRKVGVLSEDDEGRGRVQEFSSPTIGIEQCQCLTADHC